jgi:DNA end-binding protein Ku
MPARARARSRRAPEPEPEDRPRAFWSGTITFGLVSVPVDLYPAVREDATRLRMLDPEGIPLRREYWCPREDRPLAPDEIVRGVEVAKGKWVTVTDAELEALEPERTRDIALRSFVPRAEIPAAYLESGYVLTPSGKSSRAYRLLAEAMEEADRAGIATFVLREREHVVAILAENGVLRAETLRFADEVRTPGEVGLPEPPERVPAAARRAAEGALRARKGASLPKDLLEDPQAEALRKLVERKLRARRDVARTAEAGPAAAEPVDLVAVLRERMAAAR